MSRDIEAFVIHLGRAEARKAQVQRILAACPVPARILDAVDGRDLSQAEVDAVYAPDGLHRPRYPFALSRGEIGCFLSHRKAWQAIIDTGLDAGLVIEDDVEIDRATFERALILALDHVEKHGVIQFQVRPVAAGAATLAHVESVRLVEADVVPLRTSAQLVSREAAARLLAVTGRLDRPIDTFMQMQWVTGLKVAQCTPSGVKDRTAESGGSTISASKRPLPEKLTREWKRWRYRRAVGRMSRESLQPS